jgi:diguanylate cyclase (GGDEF)-like protein/PAS domain S-box-containing protein
MSSGLTARTETETRYRTLVEQLPAALYVGPYLQAEDSNFTLWYISPEIERILGYPRERWLQDPTAWLEVIVPEDRDRWVTSDPGPPSRDRRTRVEYRVVRSDGQHVWLRDEWVVIQDSAGQWFHQGLLLDVTEQRVAAEERAQLLQREQLARADAEDAYLFTSEVITHAKEGIVVYDRELRYELWNPFMEEMTGIGADEVVGRSGRDLFPHLQEQGVEELLIRALSGEAVRSPDVRYHIPQSGKTGWVSGSYSPRRDATGAIVGVIGVIGDVTERKRAETLLAAQTHVLEMIAAGSPLPDLLHAIVELVEELAPQSLCSLLLVESNDALGSTPTIRLGAARSLPAAYNEAIDGLPIGPAAGSCGTAAYRRETVISADIATDPVWKEYRHLALSHGLRACWSTPVMSSEGAVLATFAIYYRESREPTRRERDLVEIAVHLAGIAIVRHQAITALHYRAMYDPLTDLPNRTLLHDRLNQALLSAQREGGRVGLLLMDLDRFKEINDTFGHHYGDFILQQAGVRLRAGLRESDTVARLGGDEFSIVLAGTDAVGATLAADHVLHALQQPFNLESESFDIGASIGIAIFPDHGTDANTLLRRADVAMYTAKAAGSGQALYSLDQDRHSAGRLTLVRELRDAVEHNRLLLYYQPKAYVATGEVHSLEALVRWNHLERGIIFPDEFITLAEQTGLIQPLSAWVLETALRAARDWHSDGLTLPVAVNLSARSLHDPRLVDSIADLLRRLTVKPALLQLEITESAVMFDPTRAMDILVRLYEIGIDLSIDDFGTGYSSLAYLKRLPVSEIKIDKSFVIDMTRNENDAVIARSVVDLGHNLGLQVVAEGVQDQETWDLLTTMGCDLAQGYFLTPPIPADTLRTWLDER